MCSSNRINYLTRLRNYFAVPWYRSLKRVALNSAGAVTLSVFLLDVESVAAAVVGAIIANLFFAFLGIYLNRKYPVMSDSQQEGNP